MRTCPYNVLIHYVTSDGRGFATGDYPVEDFRQFVYTEDSMLVGEFPGDSCEAGVGMLTLPPGTYRLVVWGNAPGGSCRMEEINPHGSRMEDGRLHALPYGGKEASAEYANVGRLYYGTATFKVSKYGVNELTVGLMHAHARLNLTVEWKDDIPAEVRSARSPVMRLRGLHTPTTSAAAKPGEIIPSRSRIPVYLCRPIGLLPSSSPVFRSRHPLSPSASPTGAVSYWSSPNKEKG